jgi:hypothetical protein
MSRRRYVSTDISTDTQVNRLARTADDFAVMLYTWLIPHTDDEGIIYGDEEEIALQVIPGRRDKSLKDIVNALEAMEKLSLIAWDREGRRILFPVKSFYKYQTYIREERRRDAPKPPPTNGHHRTAPHDSEEQRIPALNGAQPRIAPQNTADQRISPQNTASLNPSHSPSHSLSHSLTPESIGDIQVEVAAPFAPAGAAAPPPPTPTTRRSAKKPKTPIPDPFEVTPAMAEWALKQGMTTNFIRDGTEYFVRWATMHDHRYVDWTATWENVMTSRWAEQANAAQRAPVPLRRAQ